MGIRAASSSRSTAARQQQRKVAIVGRAPSLRVPCALIDACVGITQRDPQPHVFLVRHAPSQCAVAPHTLKPTLLRRLERNLAKLGGTSAGRVW